MEDKIKEMCLDVNWTKSRVNFLDVWKLKLGDYEDACDMTVDRHDK